MRSPPSLQTVKNIRSRLRKDMVNLAKTHRVCKQARGCGCVVDLSLAVLEQAEARLFQLELMGYSDPRATRRIVNADNSISEESLADVVDRRDADE